MFGVEEELQDKIDKLQKQNVIYKIALNHYVKKDVIYNPKDIESDYDCGCCSGNSGGAVAFFALKNAEDVE